MWNTPTQTATTVQMQSGTYLNIVLWKTPPKNGIREWKSQNGAGKIASERAQAKARKHASEQKSEQWSRDIWNWCILVYTGKMPNH